MNIVWRGVGSAYCSTEREGRKGGGSYVGEEMTEEGKKGMEKEKKEMDGTNKE